MGKDKVTDCGGKGKGKRKRSNDGGIEDDKARRKREERDVLKFFDDEAYRTEEEEEDFSGGDSSYDSGDFEDIIESDFIAINDHGKSRAIVGDRCVSAVKMPPINIRTGRLKELNAKAEEAKRKATCEGALGSPAASHGRCPSEILPKKKLEALTPFIAPSRGPLTLSEFLGKFCAVKVQGNFNSPNGTAQRVIPPVDEHWNQTFPKGSASFDPNDVAWSAMMNEMVAVDTNNLETSGLDSQIACAFNHSVQAMMALSHARASLDARSSLTSKLEAELDALKAEVKKVDKCKIEAEEMTASLLKSSELLHVHLKKEKSRCAEMKKELDAAKLEMDDLKMKHESDVETREKIIANVRGELDAAQRGERLDLEELADSEAFRPTRRILEQEIARGLVKMIQNKHPNLDLSFIYDEEVGAGAE